MTALVTRSSDGATALVRERDLDRRVVVALRSRDVRGRPVVTSVRIVHDDGHTYTYRNYD